MGDGEDQSFYSAEWAGQPEEGIPKAHRPDSAAEKEDRTGVRSEQIPQPLRHQALPRDLKRGALVAYYVIKLVKAKARSPTQDVYKTCAPAWTRMPNSCRLWGRRGTSWSRSRTLEGDIGQDAGDVFGRYVFRGKPVCGHVINEPGEKETQNCVMPTTVWEASLFKQGDGRIRGTFKAGDVVFHEIRTLRSVKKGEELMTMYDDDYERDYKQGKKFEGADW